MGDAGAGETPDAECPTPTWQRQPTRVTFAAKDGKEENFTYEVRGHAVDLLNDNNDEDEEATK